MTDFSKTRAMFDIPEGMIYLNGNSLGPMPKVAPERMTRFLQDEWRTELIRGWNTKDGSWGTKDTRRFAAASDARGQLLGFLLGLLRVGWAVARGGRPPFLPQHRLSSPSTKQGLAAFKKGTPH